MNISENEDSGRIFYNGRLIKLDEMSSEDRQNAISKLSEEIETLESKIDNLLMEN